MIQTARCCRGESDGDQSELCDSKPKIGNAKQASQKVVSLLKLLKLHPLPGIWNILPVFFFRKSTRFSHRWVSTVFPGYHVHLIQTFSNPQYTETSKDLIIKTRFSFMSCKFLYIQSKRITIAFFFFLFLCAVMKFDRLTQTRSSNSRLGRGG